MPTPKSDALLRDARSLTARWSARLGRDEAAELANEAVLRALEHPAPDGRSGPWLERIFRNLVVDRWRRRSVAYAAVSAGAGAESGAPATPEEMTLATEERAALARALDAIPDELRRPLLLRYVGDMEYEGLAAALALPMVTARTRVHRSLRRLRVMLSGLRAFLLPMPGALRALALVAQPAALAVVLVASQGAPVAVGPLAQATPAASTPARVRPASPAAERAPEPAAAATPEPANTRTATTTRKAGTAPRSSTDSKEPAPMVINYDPDEIGGSVDAPTGEFLTVAGRAKQSSLIEIPENFVPSVVKSLEDF